MQRFYDILGTLLDVCRKIDFTCHMDRGAPIKPLSLKDVGPQRFYSEYFLLIRHGSWHTGNFPWYHQTLQTFSYILQKKNGRGSLTMQYDQRHPSSTKREQGLMPILDRKPRLAYCFNFKAYLTG